MKPSRKFSPDQVGFILLPLNHVKRREATLIQINLNNKYTYTYTYVCFVKYFVIHDTDQASCE